MASSARHEVLMVDEKEAKIIAPKKASEPGALIEIEEKKGIAKIMPLAEIIAETIAIELVKHFCNVPTVSSPLLSRDSFREMIELYYTKDDSEEKINQMKAALNIEGEFSLDAVSSDTERSLRRKDSEDKATAIESHCVFLLDVIGNYSNRMHSQKNTEGKDIYPVFFSELISGYRDVGEGFARRLVEGDIPLTIEAKEEGRASKQLPLRGLIPVLATARAFCNIDLVGAGGDNIGVSIQGDIAQVYMVDLGFVGKGLDLKPLADPRDIQISSGGKDIVRWNDFSPSQKDEYLRTLQNIIDNQVLLIEIFEARVRKDMEMFIASPDKMQKLKQQLDEAHKSIFNTITKGIDAIKVVYRRELADYNIRFKESIGTDMDSFNYFYKTVPHSSESRFEKIIKAGNWLEAASILAHTPALFYRGSLREILEEVNRSDPKARSKLTTAFIEYVTSIEDVTKKRELVNGVLTRSSILGDVLGQHRPGVTMFAKLESEKISQIKRAFPDLLVTPSPVSERKHR